MIATNGDQNIPMEFSVYPNGALPYVVESDGSLTQTMDIKNQAIFMGGRVWSPGTITYNIGPLSAGTYSFYDFDHPTIIKGTLIVEP